MQALPNEPVHFAVDRQHQQQHQKPQEHPQEPEGQPGAAGQEDGETDGSDDSDYGSAGEGAAADAAGLGQLEADAEEGEDGQQQQQQEPPLQEAEQDEEGAEEVQQQLERIEGSPTEKQGQQRAAVLDEEDEEEAAEEEEDRREAAEKQRHAQEKEAQQQEERQSQQHESKTQAGAAGASPTPAAHPAPHRHRKPRCAVINNVPWHLDVAAGMAWAFQEAGCSVTTYIPQNAFGIQVGGWVGGSQPGSLQSTIAGHLQPSAACLRGSEPSSFTRCLLARLPCCLPVCLPAHYCLPAGCDVWLVQGQTPAGGLDPEACLQGVRWQQLLPSLLPPLPPLNTPTHPHPPTPRTGWQPGWLKPCMPHARHQLTSPLAPVLPCPALNSAVRRRHPHHLP